MRPEQAINYPIGFGPYRGKTIGWAAKFGGAEARLWLLRQFTASKLQPETLEALRSFFVAPRYATWLKKVMGKDYCGNEPFLLPEGTVGCRACGGSPMRTESVLRCSHGTQRGIEVISACPCGWREQSDLRHASVVVRCAGCDEYPLFQRQA